MNDQSPQPAAAPSAAPAPTQPGVSISDAQLREAVAAAGEVLNGAPTSRVLELSDKISLAKVILREIAVGTLAVGRPQKERRSARHAVR